MDKTGTGLLMAKYMALCHGNMTSNQPCVSVSVHLTMNGVHVTNWPVAVKPSLKM